MKYLVTFLVLAGFIGISITVDYAYACSCSSNPDFLIVWMESSGAFQGTVKEILIGEGPRKVLFDVHQVQKGNYPNGNYTMEDSNIVYSGKDMVKFSTCSVDYKIGETYQVFTFNGNQIIGETNICTTKQISGYEEWSHEDEEGKIQHYREGYNFFTQYSLFSLIPAIAITPIIVGIVIWRKRR